MRHRLESKIQQYREIAESKLVNDPDDVAGQTLKRYTNDFDDELHSKRGSAAAVALILATTAIAADAREAVVDWHEDRDLYTTHSLVPPPAVRYQIPFIPLEHVPGERGGEYFVFTRSVASISGAHVNVAAQTVSNTFQGKSVNWKKL